MNDLKNAAKSTLNNLVRTLPVLLAVVFLIGLFKVALSYDFFLFFTDNSVLNLFLGALLGSVLAGTPITSYIMGGELISHGISVQAVTAFLVTWVTVGFVQFPAESFMFGKNFAIIRNVIAFCSAIVIGIIMMFAL
jgi:uncharacterized membrane protein YraQ (UPF0718 family)